MPVPMQPLYIEQRAEQASRNGRYISQPYNSSHHLIWRIGAGDTSNLRVPEKSVAVGSLLVLREGLQYLPHPC